MIDKLFYPRQVVLVTAAHRGKSNVTAVEWITPISRKPPMVALSFNSTSYTLELITNSKEFVIAFPSENLKDAVSLCGKTSGKFLDKFSEAKLNTENAKLVSAPIIPDAVANVECKVMTYSTCGDHVLVTADIVEFHFPKENEKPSFLFNETSKGIFELRFD